MKFNKVLGIISSSIWQEEVYRIKRQREKGRRREKDNEEEEVEEEEEEDEEWKNVFPGGSFPLYLQ